MPTWSLPAYTLDPNDPIIDRGWISVSDGRIVGLGADEPPDGRTILDCTGDHVIPGLVNTHAPTDLRALRMGGDTDTIASAIAGARYGETAIPIRWRDVEASERILAAADALFAATSAQHPHLAALTSPPTRTFTGRMVSDSLRMQPSTSYLRLGYDLIELPRTSPSTRAEAITASVNRQLSADQRRDTEPSGRLHDRAMNDNLRCPRTRRLELDTGYVRQETPRTPDLTSRVSSRGW